jgi:hypothetical protein
MDEKMDECRSLLEKKQTVTPPSKSSLPSFSPTDTRRKKTFTRREII